MIRKTKNKLEEPGKKLTTDETVVQPESLVKRLTELALAATGMIIASKIEAFLAALIEIVFYVLS